MCLLAYHFWNLCQIRIIRYIPECIDLSAKQTSGECLLILMKCLKSATGNSETLTFLSMPPNGCQQTLFATANKADSENEFTNTSSDKQEGESLCK